MSVPERDWALPEAFEVTGGVRDIHVLETGLDDWSAFLRFVKVSYRTEFSINDEPRSLPEDPAQVLQETYRTPVLLKIFLDGVQVNCRFLPGDMELFLDPEEVRTQGDVDHVLRFLKELGDLLPLTPVSRRRPNHCPG
jgi:hypothetical protein